LSVDSPAHETWVRTGRDANSENECAVPLGRAWTEPVLIDAATPAVLTEGADVGFDRKEQRGKASCESSRKSENCDKSFQ
jgi:hypothetical protein